MQTVRQTIAFKSTSGGISSEVRLKRFGVPARGGAAVRQIRAPQLAIVHPSRRCGSRRLHFPCCWPGRSALPGGNSAPPFEQFQGYFGLEDIDLAAFQSRTVPMDVLLGRSPRSRWSRSRAVPATPLAQPLEAASGSERIRRSQVIEQPDVVMLVLLLWDRSPPRGVEGQFRILRAALRTWQLVEPGHSRTPHECAGHPRPTHWL